MASRVFSYIFLLFCFHPLITHSHPFESSTNILSPSKYLDYDSYSKYKKYKKENVWDNSLKLALRKYQEFYNLNVIGVLDNDTIRKMHEPRCGMPDFCNPNKRVPYHMVSHDSFFLGNRGWQKKNLSYAFDWNVREEFKMPLEHALKEWASMTPFKFYRVKNFGQANIKISFMSGDHGNGYPFRHPSGGLAHTFAPPDGRAHFDVNQYWSWTGNRYMSLMSKQLDCKSLATPLGNVGLQHSNVTNAIMYPMIYPGERKRLSRDDINGIKALYK
ncbi:Stromelysin 1 [Handroanthus impetiginosus]|uniref:Stromelysin 1 n=1 Tax=Handroanthus impetiginosus TaxID=429701 RepID=A0A2G9I9P6_9LAMI|nr:Stromelysin 1 [Handroanthus impetiginosus]